MGKKIERKTRLADYIIDNYGSVCAFTRELNRWAKMRIYRPTGRTTLHDYANGAFEPATPSSVKKWGIVCDFIQQIGGERPTMDWIKPRKETQLEIPKINETETDPIPTEHAAALSPEFAEIGRAFDTLTRYFETIITNNNNKN